MSTYFPSAADLADDTLATKPHSTLHGDLGDALSDRITALGKVDLTGFGTLPTMMDVDSTQFDDAGWWQIDYSSGVTVRAGPIELQGAAVFDFESPNNKATIKMFLPASTGVAATAQQNYESDSDSGDEFAFVAINTTILGNGTGRAASVALSTDLGDGVVQCQVTDAGAQIYVVAIPSQTDELVECLDENSVQVFAIGAAGEIRTDQTATASVSVGTLNNKLPIYDETGSLLGYIPIYATIT